MDRELAEIEFGLRSSQAFYDWQEETFHKVTEEHDAVPRWRWIKAWKLRRELYALRRLALIPAMKQVLSWERKLIDLRTTRREAKYSAWKASHS